MKIDTTCNNLTTAKILFSKCKRLDFRLSHSLAVVWFACMHKRKLKGNGDSLSAWTKTFEGRETNPGEHGEAIRLALFNERSGPQSATCMKFLLSSSLCYHRPHLHLFFILSNLPCVVMYEHTRFIEQENGNSAARAVH